MSASDEVRRPVLSCEDYTRLCTKQLPVHATENVAEYRELYRAVPLLGDSDCCPEPLAGVIDKVAIVVHGPIIR